MNTKIKQLSAQFAGETRFEVPAILAAPFRGAREEELDRFKNVLLQRFFDEWDNPELHPVLRRAANEAAALAWLTPYPLLLLPVLLDEKARIALDQSERQDRIRTRSKYLLPGTEKVPAT